MKQLTEYSAKSLYSFFKKEEICFVIEQKSDWISDTSDVTDDLEEARELAKENETQIFIYTKKLNYVDDFVPRKDSENSWFADELVGVLKDE